MQTLLLALRRHPTQGWIIAICYAALVTFPHEQVQTVVNKIADAMGHSRFYLMMGTLALIGAAALSLALFRALREHSGRWTLAIFWLLTLCLILATWKILTFNNSELVHYPQYFPLGVLLVALTASPVEALAWCVLIGGLDEGFQYAVLHGGWGVPFDFNDVYMDLLGAALGALFALACLPTCPPARRRRPGIIIILSIAVAGIALWAAGVMQLYQSPARHWFALSRLSPRGFWFQDITWGPHKTHILTPVEGPILILATLALYAIMERRARVFHRL